MNKKAFNGKWRVSELEDHDQEYIDLAQNPFVFLEVSGRGEVDGTFEFGAQAGNLDGRIEKTGDGRLKMTFTFEGEDEGDLIHGYGIAILINENTLSL